MIKLFQRSFDPEKIEKQYYRMYIVAEYMAILSAIGHAVYILIFVWMGVNFMAYLNIASSLIWLFVFILNRKQKFMASVIIAILELMAHASIAVYVIGLGGGFQLFLFAIIPFLFFIPSKGYILKSIMVGFLGILYVFLYYYAKTHDPLAIVQSNRLLFVYAYNCLIMFLALALMAYYYVRVARKAEQALEIEFQRSESLLLNILPAPIATRLKEQSRNQTIADGYENVTVLFADMVGFTKYCAKTPPEETVAMLNEIFSIFDVLTEKHQLEKIKTIGDAYMVVGGVPIYSDDHGCRVAAMALDMLESIREHPTFNLRIGICSGPVVAGVIGTRKFAYDLWGDTVNTSSRMESHGLPGEIQVTESTYQLLKNDFVLEERGVIEVKGKGKIKTYWLKDRM